MRALGPGRSGGPFRFASTCCEAAQAVSNRPFERVTDEWLSRSFDSNLIGKWIEICWPYKKDGATVKIWACVADVLVVLGSQLALEVQQVHLVPTAQGHDLR